MNSTPAAASKSKVLTVVIIAIFTDMLMYGLVVPFLPIYAESLGASQSEIGLLFASYAIALFAGTPIFGALADRVGRKKLLVCGLLGPLIGGWLFEWGGYKLPFFTATGVAALAALLSVLLLKNVQDARSESFISPFKILRSKRMLTIAGVAVIGSSVFASIEPTLPIHFSKDLNLSPGVIGTMFIVVTLSYGLMAPMIGAFSTKFGHIKTIMAGIVLAAIILPLNAFPTQLWVQVVTLALLGISLGCVLTPSMPKLVEISQSLGNVSQGVTFAIYNTAYSLGMMLGPLIASSLAGHFGLEIAYLTLGVIFLIYLIPLNKLRT